MNDNSPPSQDTHKTFLLLSEIEKEEKLSQRELANRLGIALGLVNSYLKNLVNKGFVRVKAFPRNRYGYLLTPKGIAEKSRLAYHHLSYFTSLYTTTRQEYVDLFKRLKQQGVDAVSFCGVDEVAEIAYMSLQEVGLRLSTVMDDDDQDGRELFGSRVLPIAEGVRCAEGRIVITSLKRYDELKDELSRSGCKDEVYGPRSLT